MPAVSQATTIVLNQAPVGWLYKLDPTYAATDLMATSGAAVKFLFDNVSDGKAKIIRPESVANAEEFTEISRADGAIFQFPKKTIKIDGVSGIVKTGGSSVGVTKGEISFSVGAIPVTAYTGTAPDEVPTYMSGGWQAFLEKIRTNIAAEWLCVIPIGFNYESWADRAGSGTVEGYAAVIGTMGVDLEQAATYGAAMKIPFTITGRQIAASDLADAADKLATLNLPKIICYEGAEDGEQYKIDPPAITSEHAAELVLGAGVFMAAA